MRGMPVPTNNRHYRTWRNRLAVYPFGILIGILGLILAAASPAPVAVRIVGVAGIPLAWLYIRRGTRIGVEVTNDGIVVYGPLSTQRVSTADVLNVGTHRWFMNQVVHLDLRDGRRVETNLIQGVLVTWHGGKTKDILSVLQRELDHQGLECSAV
jgi:xanthosine utilization system XapX-like protein